MKIIPFIITSVILIMSFTISTQAVQMTGKKTRLNLIFKTQTSTYSGAIASPTPNPSPAEEKKEEDLTPVKELYSVSLGYNSIDKSPLAIEVTPRTVDYGSLSPTIAITRSQTVSVQKGPSPIYSLYIAEDHPPLDASGSGKFIPNTTGDKDKATVSKSAYWINPLTYGFGYYARSNISKISEFDREDTYKQFASIENGLPPETLLKNSRQDEEVNVILKININNNQTDTNYQNIIYYTLIPSL